MKFFHKVISTNPKIFYPHSSSVNRLGISLEISCIKSKTFSMEKVAIPQILRVWIDGI